MPPPEAHRSARIDRHFCSEWPLCMSEPAHRLRALERQLDRLRRAPIPRRVIYRKLSFGRQSEIGEQRIARLLSAPTTCRLQRRSLHADLIDLLGAHARGDQRPCWPDARPASLNAYPSASNALRGPRK